MIFTAEQKRQAVDRELTYRRRVFARMVEAGKMAKKAMNEQIAIFEAIRDDYAKAETSERLI
jgi:hypothetical protein